MNYRNYRPADFDDLLAMVESLNREDGGKPFVRDHLERTLAHFDRQPASGRVVIFDDGGETCGYSILVYTWSNEYGGLFATVDELYVTPARRGAGLATDFLGSLAPLLPTAVVGVQLEVSPGNDRAAVLYRKIGFEDACNRHMIRML